MATTSARHMGPKLEPHQIILRPMVTEKGTHQSTNERHNAYSFVVNLWATKTEIKHAVQELFNVRVVGVRTQLRLGKKRRYRFKEGKESNWKKAIDEIPDAARNARNFRFAAACRRAGSQPLSPSALRKPCGSARNATTA